MSAAAGRIGGLDGLRALAIACVLFAHAYASAGFPQAGWIYQAQRTFSGLFGVQVFFAISGFIITLLLCREKEKFGAVSLKHFWLRRALRILPPVAAYLAVIQLLPAFGATAAPPLETQLGSLLFYRNVMPNAPWFTEAQGFTAHFWTLSLEEQFYIFWPLLVGALSLSWLRRVAWVGVALALASRCALTALPAGAERWLPLNLDGFMFGALAAVAVASGASAAGPGFSGLLRFRWPLLALALVLTRLRASEWQAWVAPAQPLAVSAVSALWIIHVIQHPSGVTARILKSRPLAALGLISYSTYLWQQLFLAPAAHWPGGEAPWFARFPQNLALALAAGAAGYLLIEMPCQWLKNGLGRGKAAHPAPPPLANVSTSLT